MADKKDYYETLGVSRDASADDILVRIEEHVELPGGGCNFGVDIQVVVCPQVEGGIRTGRLGDRIANGDISGPGPAAGGVDDDCSPGV